MRSRASRARRTSSSFPVLPICSRNRGLSRSWRPSPEAGLARTFPESVRRRGLSDFQRAFPPEETTMRRRKNDESSERARKAYEQSYGDAEPGGWAPRGRYEDIAER